MPTCKCVNVQIGLKKSHFNSYKTLNLHLLITTFAYLHVYKFAHLQIRIVDVKVYLCQNFEFKRMKSKTSPLTKLTLGLMVAGTIVACNQNKSADKSVATASPSSGNIVYVNQDTLLSKYEYFKDMSKRLEDKGKSAQSDVGSRQQALQREAAEYQRSANTLSADQRASTEQRLQREGQEFQQYQQNAAAQYQNEQADEQKKLYEKVAAFMKDYAKEKGYKMILTFQKGNTTMWYGDPGLDVTSDVIKRLNDAYVKDKK
jgi:outer membrane protein